MGVVGALLVTIGIALAALAATGGDEPATTTLPVAPPTSTEPEPTSTSVATTTTISVSNTLAPTSTTGASTSTTKAPTTTTKKPTTTTKASTTTTVKPTTTTVKPTTTTVKPTTTTRRTTTTLPPTTTTLAPTTTLPPVVGKGFASVTGTVDLEVPGQVPDDAVVEVKLTRSGERPTLVALQRIFARGRQTPFVFDLRYDILTIEDSADYTVEAAIRVNTTVLYETPAPQAVVTQGNPAYVQLVLRATK